MESINQTLRDCSQSEFQYDIIMIGHNIKRKNYLFALKVIDSVSRQLGRKIRLCIVGNNTDKIKEDIDYQTISISCYSGLSTEKLHEVIVKSKFYLNTSYLEGYCIPFIECQSLGLIPIVPNFDIFQENCFSKHAYFSKLSLKEFSNKIYTAFVNHESLIRPSTDNVDKARQERFNNYNIIKDIDCFWEKIMYKA